jgi:hypothetical protein
MAVSQPGPSLPPPCLEARHVAVSALSRAETHGGRVPSRRKRMYSAATQCAAISVPSRHPRIAPRDKCAPLSPCRRSVHHAIHPRSTTPSTLHHAIRGPPLVHRVAAAPADPALTVWRCSPHCLADQHSLSGGPAPTVWQHSPSGPPRHHSLSGHSLSGGQALTDSLSVRLSGEQGSRTSAPQYTARASTRS